jgi:hypothetical protein
MPTYVSLIHFTRRYREHQGGIRAARPGQQVPGGAAERRPSSRDGGTMPTRFEMPNDEAAPARGAGQRTGNTMRLHAPSPTE